MNNQIACYIADDSSLIRKIMSDICDEMGLSVLAEYENGDSMYESLTILERTSPDVIFLDINMPGRSGKDLLDLLLDLNPEFIIIIVSSVDDTLLIKECLELGASNFIHKNTGKNAMKEIITTTLKNNGLV